MGNDRLTTRGCQGEDPISFLFRPLSGVILTVRLRFGVLRISGDRQVGSWRLRPLGVSMNTFEGMSIDTWGSWRPPEK
jgi:hypothetical protein